MLKKVKLGIIGLGYIGQIHFKHSLALPNAEVIAVADISAKALSKARKTGIKHIYTDYESLLQRPDIDAVVIGLPTHLHLQCAEKAAEAHKHIFLEKPIARNVPEARKILTAARKYNVKLMVGYPLRFNDDFKQARKEIQAGFLGDVESAHATYISSGPFFHRAEGYSPVPVPEWWFDESLTGGGVLIDLGSHIINLLRWYFGEVTNIKGYFGHRFNLSFEDSAICIVKFNSGTTAVMNVGWYSQSYTLTLNLLGTVRSATIEHKPGSPILTAIQLLSTGNSKFYKPHMQELQHFLSCIIKDIPPSPSGEDGLKDLEVIEKAYKNQIVLQ
jgi:predicted dehydrogenase